MIPLSCLVQLEFATVGNLFYAYSSDCTQADILNAPTQLITFDTYVCKLRHLLRGKQLELALV